ncbi:MAG: hypothetical protein M1839_001268 [Geoglossum umbratile]|nr:MAG: hypothetical protein M1839_001268 [Geoglossum umbratile]
MRHLTHSSGFRTLYGASKVTSFIVVIPGLGTLSPETWGKSSGKPWLESLLLNAAPNASILCFDHGLSKDDAFSWQRLVDSGADLLDNILKLREDESVQEFPFLFVCHSLGGIIVKQALCLAQQDLSRFRNLLGVVAGLILMGTPHSKGANDELWRNVAIIPKTSLKRFSKHALTSEEAAIFGNISRQFETIEPPIPILSTYETRATRIRGGGIGVLQVKNTLLVKREYSLTHLPKEQDLEVDADHNTLCDIGSRSAAYQKIAAFVREAIEATQRDLFLYPTSSHSSALGDTNEQDSHVEIDPQGLRPGSVGPQGGAPFEQKSQNPTPQIKRRTTADASRLATFEMISQASNFSQEDPRLPCFLRKAHIRNPDFFGRGDVLRKMEDALLPPSPMKAGTSRTELRTFGLCGLGGVGKTEIAVEFMFAHRDDYDAVFWVQADEPAKIADGFCQLAVELGLEESGAIQNQAVSRDLVKRWLCCPLKHYRRPSMPLEEEYASWLLILDNVDDPAILGNYWPSEGIGSILVTSRDPLAKGRAFRMTAGITLQPFDERDAAKFLVELTESDSEDEDGDYEGGTRQQGAIPEEALAIARRLGGLPLALSQMAGVINRRYLSYQEFLSLCDEEQSLKELHSLNLGVQDTGYKHTLASVWALDQLGKGASLLLDVMSLIDPDRIQEDILTCGASEVSVDGYPAESSDYLQARAELTKSSLITRNKNQCVIRLHRLTQDGVRAKMGQEHLHQIFDAAVTLISAVWPFVTIDWRHSTSRWEKCEALVPHVLRLKNFYSSFILPKEIFKAGIKFAKLLNDVGWYYYERSIPENCEPFFQLAQLVCESQDEDAVDLLSDVFYSRGADASEVNEPVRCMEYTSRFWKLRLKHAETSPKGRKDIRLGMSYNQMGVAYMMARDYESAVGVLEQAFEVYASVENSTPIMATLPAANMGLACWFLGRYDEAYKALINILRERERVFGVNDSESFKTGRVLHALGNVRASQGRLKDSFDYHQRALLQYRSTIGDNHHRTADVCYKVAGHYMRFGKLEDAKKLLGQALKVFSSRSHYKHENARTGHLMGRLMALMGDEKTSEQYFGEAYALYQVLKPDDRRTKDELSDADFEELVCFWSR